MNRSIGLFLGVAVIATQLTTAASATGQNVGRQALRHCGSDAARLCGHVVPGGGRIAECLFKQTDSLSASCGAFLTKAKTARTVLFACQADAARNCANVQPGGGRIVLCLNDKRASLSDGCKRALNQAETLLRP